MISSSIYEEDNPFHPAFVFSKADTSIAICIYCIVALACKFIIYLKQQHETFVIAITKVPVFSYVQLGGNYNVGLLVLLYNSLLQKSTN